VALTRTWVTLTGEAVEPIGAGETASDAPIASDPVGNGWEYRVVKNLTAARLEESLNSLGAEGWELVAMAGLDGVLSVTGNKLYAVMKRPRQKSEGAATLADLA